MLDLVPHRAPILLLEQVALRTSDHAEADAIVRAGPHCPDGALWEGSLIEGLAQTAALLRPDPDALGLLVGVRRLVVHRRPVLGEPVRFAVRVARRVDAVTLVDGEARVGDEVVAAGQLKLFEPEPRSTLDPEPRS